jgi:hypothetical protein
MSEPSLDKAYAELIASGQPSDQAGPSRTPRTKKPLVVRAGARVYQIERLKLWKEYLPGTRSEDELFDLLKNFGKLLYRYHAEGTWYLAGVPADREVSAEQLKTIRALPDMLKNFRLHGKF